MDRYGCPPFPLRALLWGFFVFAVFFEGWYIRVLGWGMRIVFAGVALALLWPNLYVDIAAFAVFVMLTVFLKTTKSKQPEMAQA